MTTKEQLNVGLQHVSLTTAAQILLARVATNVGKNFATLLNAIALELCQSVPIYGLDGRTKTIRAINPEEIRAALFTNGALVLRTASDSVFTQLTVRRADLNAYLTGSDRMDIGAWAAAKASRTAIGTSR